MGMCVRYQASAPSGGEAELLVCPRIKVVIPLLANSKGWFFECVLPWVGRGGCMKTLTFAP
jgi:hypothetical protein